MCEDFEYACVKLHCTNVLSLINTLIQKDETPIGFGSTNGFEAYSLQQRTFLCCLNATIRFLPSNCRVVISTFPLATETVYLVIFSGESGDEKRVLTQEEVVNLISVKRDKVHTDRSI